MQEWIDFMEEFLSYCTDRYGYDYTCYASVEGWWNNHACYASAWDLRDNSACILPDYDW